MQISVNNIDNFIRNMITVKDASCRPLIVPPIRKQNLPGVSPLDWEDLRIDLRLDNEADEPNINRLILAAADFFERSSGLVCTPGTYTAELPGWWYGEPAFVRRGPLREVSIDYMASRDVWTAVDASDFYAADCTEKSFDITLLSGFDRPQLWSERPRVRITFTAGYKAVGDQSGVEAPEMPDGVRTVLTALVAHFYRYRELFDADKVAEVEMSAGSLLQKYRSFW